MLVKVDYDNWAKGQRVESSHFLVGKKYAVGPGLSRNNILGCFHPTAGITEDKDKDNGRQDDILMSPGQEIRVLSFADSLCSAVRD